MRLWSGNDALETPSCRDEAAGEGEKSLEVAEGVDSVDVGRKGWKETGKKMGRRLCGLGRGKGELKNRD